MEEDNCLPNEGLAVSPPGILSTVPCSTPMVECQESSIEEDSLNAKSQSEFLEPLCSGRGQDTFEIDQQGDTNNSSDKQQSKSSEDKESGNTTEFDDVFGSDPAWIDIPEEYLDISGTPCCVRQARKDSCGSSDFSFDIEAILSSVRAAASNKKSKESELVNGLHPESGNDPEEVQQNMNTNGENKHEEDSTIPGNPIVGDQGDEKVDTTSSTPAITLPLEPQLSSSNDVSTVADQTATDETAGNGVVSTVNAGDESEGKVINEKILDENNNYHEGNDDCGKENGLNVEKRKRRGTFTKEDSDSDIHTEEPPSTTSCASDPFTASCASDPSFDCASDPSLKQNSTLSYPLSECVSEPLLKRDSDPSLECVSDPTLSTGKSPEPNTTDQGPSTKCKLPTTQIKSTSSISIESSSGSVSSQTVRKTEGKGIRQPLVKNVTKPSGRSLKKPGQSLLPSKPCTSLKVSKSQTTIGRSSTTSSSNIAKRGTSVSKTGLTKPPPQVSEEDRNVGPKSTNPVKSSTSSALMGQGKKPKPAGSGLPLKASPIKPVPIKMEPAKKRPVNSGISRPVASGVAGKSSALQKPKTAPTIGKSSSGLTKPVPSSSSTTRAVKPTGSKRESSIPGVSGVPKRKSIATSTPSKHPTDRAGSAHSSPALIKKNGEGEKSSVAIQNKKRRSLIPTPSRAKDVSPTKKVLAPIPMNMEDGHKRPKNGTKAPPKGIVPASRGTKKSLLQGPRSAPKGKDKEDITNSQPDTPNTSGLGQDPIDFELQLIKQQKKKLCAKVMHSPIDKENKTATPHSEWSPIKRKKGVVIAGDECFQCTKYTSIKD